MCLASCGVNFKTRYSDESKVFKYMKIFHTAEIVELKRIERPFSLSAIKTSRINTFG